MKCFVNLIRFPSIYVYCLSLFQDVLDLKKHCCRWGFLILSVGSGTLDLATDAFVGSAKELTLAGVTGVRVDLSATDALASASSSQTSSHLV